MADHHHAAREFEQRVFQRAQRFDVEVVGRFVQQQHVAAGDQRLGQVQPAALAAGQVPTLFCWSPPLKLKRPQIGAAGHLELADVQDVEAAGDVFPHGLVVRQFVAVLVDEGHLHGRADLHFAAVRLFLAGDQLEQRRLAGAVGADDADDGAGRHLEAQVVDQQAVAEGLADVLELDHFVAQALGHRDEDLLRLVALLVFEVGQFLEAGQPRLALGLAGLGVLAHPLQFLLHRLGVRVLGLLLLLQARFLLLQPGAVVALPRNARAAVQFEDPFGGVVEEVAVVGDGHHGAGEALQELLEPLDAFGVQVVGRLVEQQHVGLGQQQAAQRHAALLAAGQHADDRVPGRQAQRVGGDLELLVGVSAPAAAMMRFQLGLLGGERVEVGVRLGVGGVDLLEPPWRRATSPMPSSTASRTVCSGSSCGSCGR